MREPSEHEVTIEHLIKLVHAYTDPIRIHVVMNGMGKFDEVKNMHDFDLVDRLFKGSRQSDKEMDRLMKYYKDVPVWNWMEHILQTKGEQSQWESVRTVTTPTFVRDGLRNRTI